MKSRAVLIGTLFAVSVLLLATQKLFFLSYYAHLCTSLGGVGIGRTLIHAWQTDLPITTVLLIIPIAVVIGSYWIWLPERWWRRIIYSWLVGFSLLSATAFALDLGLYGHWGFKLSNLIFTYLTDWRALTPTLDRGETTTIVLLFAVDLLIMLAAYWFAVRHARFERVTGRMRVVGTGLAAALLGLSIWTLYNLRSIYPTTEGASQRTFMSHAAINPLTSLLRSITRSRCFEDYGRFYSESERATRFAALQSDPTAARQQVLNNERPNIAIIICESFSRSMMDKINHGANVMPNMQRLKTDGIWFENIYANSFRTDRGLVAILNGFPAQPNHTLLRMQSKTIHLPSLARTLGAYGYRSSVLYGGNLNFTQMSAYFRATRWEKICSQRDLTHLHVKPSSWGYNDAVMGNLFVEQLCKAATRKEPFLATWLTLSSHPPFDVPEYRFKNRLDNAMAFSDAAVGCVIDSLRKTPVWKNLLVIVIADHTPSFPPTSKHDSPLRHHIPMIWTGGAIKQPMHIDTYLSQTDLAATLLGQMRIPTRDFPFSHDRLAKNQSDAFAYYTFLDGFGIVDQAGFTLYDVTNHSVRESQGGDSTRRIDRGKAILQSTYHAMDAL